MILAPTLPSMVGWGHQPTKGNAMTARRARFFLATLISLFLLTLIPLTRTPAPTPCRVITPAADIAYWVDAQDDLILDYRGDLNAWIGTDLQGNAHLLGFAPAEDADITTCA